MSNKVTLGGGTFGSIQKSWFKSSNLFHLFNIICALILTHVFEDLEIVCSNLFFID